MNNSPITHEYEKLDIFVAGTRNSILMVESEIKELPETQVIESIEFGLNAIGDLTDLLEKFTVASNASNPKELLNPNNLHKRTLRNTESIHLERCESGLFNC